MANRKINSLYPAKLRYELTIAAVSIFASVAMADAPEVSWVPVDASAPFTTAQPDGQGQDTEIILPVGSAYIVEFELRVAGWGDAISSPELGTAQATLDAKGLLGVTANPANPGVDLVPLENQAWRESPGGAGKSDGAFMATKACHDSEMVDAGRVCASVGYNVWDPCLPGTTCSEKDDFVFSSNLAVGAVSTYIDYTWGGVSNPGQCTIDTGGSYYFGTLVLNVPAAAVGTYTFGFNPIFNYTFLNNCGGSIIHPFPLRTPGHVTLALGSCCSINERICTDNVHPDDCAPPNVFYPATPNCADIPDDDGDGTNDCEDACPFNPDYAFDPGPCNCSSADSDNDGTLDCLDACPNDPAKTDPGLCGCGVDDYADSDADGVPDCTDQCPGIDDATFAPECAAAIPTTTAWGLAVTALLLLVGAKMYFGRRLPT